MVARRHCLSFLAVLNEVRQEIGEDALPAYCRDKLSISHDTIKKIIIILDEDDRKREQYALAKDKLAAKEQKRLDDKARKRAKCLETIEKADKKKQEAQTLLESLQDEPMLKMASATGG